MSKFRVILAGLLLAIGSSTGAQNVTPEGFEYSTFVGYQAWFNVPNDGMSRGWTHWNRNPFAAMTASTMIVDMWPDLTEYPSTAIQATPFSYGGGGYAYAYTGVADGVVDAHFRWMQEYKIKGAFLQWFVVDDMAYRLGIATTAKAKAEKYGRKLVIEFDISGTKNQPNCGTGAALVQCLKTRWMSAVDAGITSSAAYQTFNGRPLVAVYGIGMKTQDHLTAVDAANLITWFKTGAPTQYRASIMGGVATGWRTNGTDAISTNGSQWQSNYASLDIISPWTVNRYNSPSAAASYISSNTGPDLTVIRQRNQRYLPVVFPGYSATNLAATPANEVQRFGGDFLWSQTRAHAALGETGFFVAMFDEIDEGTAIYKTAPTSTTAPSSFYTVKLNADGATLPSDWYLQVNRTLVDAIAQPGYSGFLSTTLPMFAVAGGLSMPAGTIRTGGPFTFNYQTDGNLVVYRLGVPVWASGTGGYLCSPTTCSAIFQSDGNFVLYQNSTPYWYTSTVAPGGRLVVTSSDPFLTVLAQDGTTLFTTGSSISTPVGVFNLRAVTNVWFNGGRMTYQADGNLVIYDTTGQPLWASGTGGGATCSPTSCFATFKTDGTFTLSRNGIVYFSTAGGNGNSRLNIGASPPYLSLTLEGQQVWP